MVLAFGIAAVLGKRYAEKPSLEETRSPVPGSAAASVASPRPRPNPAPQAGAPDAAAEGGTHAGPETLFSAAWGGDLNQLGRDRPTEGNPEGPMSLAVDRNGRVLVLDQVNNRIVRYGADGKPERALPTELRTAQDMTVAPDGTLAVLERVHDKAVVLFDDAGRQIGELPLLGEGIEEPGHVTGIFVDGKDVYAEREHGALVKLGDTTGKPAGTRAEIPGRPSGDGQLYLSAGIIQAQAGRAYVSAIDRAKMENRFTRELRFEAVLDVILLLDSDRAGVIYFAVQGRSPSGEEAVLLTCLEPSRGQTIGGAVLPVNTLPEETFRDLAVLDEGGVVHALRSEAGTTYQRYDCQ